jgi:hypothetical protein
MFYAGIYCDDESGSCFAAVVEKVLKNARKEYRIAALRRFPMADMVKEVRAVYGDLDFLRKKKVFSQDRRPPKTTYTPPLLILAVKSNDPSIVNSLRDVEIPVEGFYFRTEPGWNREEMKILRFGSNLHVFKDDFMKLVPALESSSILKFGENHDPAGDLGNEIEKTVEHVRSKGVLPSDIHGIVTGLLMALWHCETIKPVKRYGG